MLKHQKKGLEEEAAAVKENAEQFEQQALHAERELVECNTEMYKAICKRNELMANLKCHSKCAEKFQRDFKAM